MNQLTQQAMVYNDEYDFIPSSSSFEDASFEKVARLKRRLDQLGSNTPIVIIGKQPDVQDFMLIDPHSALKWFWQKPEPLDGKTTFDFNKNYNVEATSDWAIKPNIIKVKINEANRWSEIESKFLTLMRKWKQETQMLSSLTEIVTRPSYQKIIGMGPAVISLILHELQKEYDYWFWALQAITGENPVPNSAKGSLKQMTEAWLKWGQQNRYL